MAKDIHNLSRVMERAVRKYFSEDGFFPEDVEDLKRLYEDFLANGLSPGRITKNITTLHTLSKKLGKPFKKAGERDLKTLVAKLEQEGYADWTKHDFKVILRKYMRFLGKEDAMSWLKIKRAKNSKLPQEVLIEVEIKKLAEAAYTTRDRAFILALYESGCRIGEFLPLKLKQVSFDEYGAVLYVTGKTGERRVRLVASALSIQRWVEGHPNKNDPESYLWTKIPMPNNPKWSNKHLSYGFTCRLLKELAKKTQIKKKVNPHAFRHARATFMAKHLTEAQMKEFFGWVQASYMASVYVHLSGRDVDNAVLGVYGLQEAKESQDPVIKVQECRRCGEKNDPAAMFCRKCGLPSGKGPLIQTPDEKVDKIVEMVLEKFLSDSVIRERAKELLA